jgi:hypothetical protein
MSFSRDFFYRLNTVISRPDRGSAENKLTILPGRLQRYDLVRFSSSLLVPYQWLTTGPY